MAIIKTTDGEVHKVKEAVSEIDILLSTKDKCFIHLNVKYSISGYEDGIETIRSEYQKTSFMTQEIIMYQ